MSKSRIKRIAITLGDPCGIGPEVIAKAVRRIRIPKNIQLNIIGSESIFDRYFSGLRTKCGFLAAEQGRHFTPGRPTTASARASLTYLKKAVALLKQKKARALVTGPLSKDAIISLGEKFEGHTEYLARHFHAQKFGMMFVAADLKTVVVTRHIPVSKISRTLTKDMILEAIVLTHQTLKKHFSIKNAKIAVCGLNPHAGEKGRIGKEELTAIIPAVNQAKRRGIKTFGPFSADTIFYGKRSGKYDCIIAMYHDQGIIPVKALYFEQVVNFTMGLPFIRTSPAHGTAFDIAGKNKADSSSMEEAIALAIRLA